MKRMLLIPLLFVALSHLRAADDAEVAALAARVAQVQIDPANKHDRYVLIAVKQALEALREGNYGVGAVIVDADGEVDVKGHNHVYNPYHRGDLHAEMTVLLLAEERDRDDGHKRRGCTLYTSVEPCVMCTARVLGSGVKACYWASDDGPSGMMSRKELLPPSYHKHFDKGTYQKCPCSAELSKIAADIYQASFSRLGRR